MARSGSTANRGRGASRGAAGERSVDVSHRASATSGTPARSPSTSRRGTASRLAAAPRSLYRFGGETTRTREGHPPLEPYDPIQRAGRAQAVSDWSIREYCEAWRGSVPDGQAGGSGRSAWAVRPRRRCHARDRWCGDGDHGYEGNASVQVRVAGNPSCPDGTSEAGTIKIEAANSSRVTTTAGSYPRPGRRSRFGRLDAPRHPHVRDDGRHRQGR